MSSPTAVSNSPQDFRGAPSDWPDLVQAEEIAVPSAQGLQKFSPTSVLLAGGKATQAYPDTLFVDLGNPTNTSVVDWVMRGKSGIYIPENAAARDLVKSYGLEITSFGHAVDLPNTAEGGKILAQMNEAQGRTFLPSGKMSPAFQKAYQEWSWAYGGAKLLGAAESLAQGRVAVRGGARVSGAPVPRSTGGRNFSQPGATRPNTTPGTAAKTTRAPTVTAESLAQTTRSQLAQQNWLGAGRSIEALKTTEAQARQAGQTQRADAIGVVRAQLQGQRSALMRKINDPQTSALRSTLAAKKAFNNPAHWNTSGKLIVPKAGSLSGEPLRRWERLSAKFEGLTDSLFDANLRGGFNAISAVLTQAKSPKTLTLGDLADLHFVGFNSGGTKSLGGQAVNNPALHDAVHSIVAYGVSSEQEWKGDLHSEAVLTDVFTGPNAVRLDPKRSLSEQPKAAKEIATRIKAAFAQLKIDNIVGEISLVQPQFSNPKLTAAQAEEILVGNGTLAHLSSTNGAIIKGMIYDKKNSDSFAAISGRLAKGGSLTTYRTQVDAWAERVKTQVIAMSDKNMMKEGEFTFHAERAVALGVLLNRVQPGAMSDSPLETPLDGSKLNAKTRNLDLRTTYPAALQDVRKALSAAQK